MRISDWSSDVCSSDLCRIQPPIGHPDEFEWLQFPCMTELLGVGRGDGPLDRDQKRGTGSGQYRHAFGGGTRRQRLVLPCAQIVAVQDAAADKRHTAERIDQIGRASCRERVWRYV